MTDFTPVNLGALPPPDVIETLDAEVILSEILTDFQTRFPGFDALVESDPILKLAEVAAFRETLLRARINDAARDVLLASSTGTTLDHIAALFGVIRLVVTPADPNATPPVAEVLESDPDLRLRVQLALEASTAAGTIGRYLFYALGADGNVAHATVTSPVPGDVLITVLSRTGDGTPDQALLDTVDAVLQSDDVRQLTDTVITAAPTIVVFDVTATLFFLPGAAAEVAYETAEANLNAFLAEPRRLDRNVARSALFAALHVEGVARVEIAAPAADLVIGPTEAASVGTVTLTDGGVDVG